MVGVFTSPVGIGPAPVGPATSLLQGIGQDRATFLLTDTCNLNCSHCFAPDGVGQIEQEVIKPAIDELRGLPNLYFSGGEPFLYPDFLDLIHYSAERVGRVHIATNGSFVPDDAEEAKAYLSQFPPNVTFILSADRYHADALQRAGMSLPVIFRTLYPATSALQLGLELFVRYPPHTKLSAETAGGIDSVVFDKLVRSERVHGNSVHRQNSAQVLPQRDTKPVLLRDFVGHSKKLGKLGVFVTQRGLVTDNSHAAYMRWLPPFTVLGDLHNNTLADIIRYRLAPYQGKHPRQIAYEEVRDFLASESGVSLRDNYFKPKTLFDIIAERDAEDMIKNAIQIFLLASTSASSIAPVISRLFPLLVPLVIEKAEGPNADVPPIIYDDKDPYNVITGFLETLKGFMEPSRYEEFLVEIYRMIHEVLMESRSDVKRSKKRSSLEKLLHEARAKLGIKMSRWELFKEWLLL